MYVFPALRACPYRLLKQPENYRTPSAPPFPLSPPTFGAYPNQVRVLQDRNIYGRIPIAGRLPFSKRGWVIAALGARGLIHHAYLGRLVAACALLDCDEQLPPQVMAPLEDLGKESTGDL